MNDDETLRDAFAEYERRADALNPTRGAGTEFGPARSGRSNRTPALLVAASVALVLAVAATVVGFAGGFGSSHDSGGQAGGHQPVAPRTSGSTTVTVPPSPDGPSVPANAEQMESAFRRALGGTATVTVTETHGNDISGVLTDSSTGHQGGFDIQALDGSPGDRAFCEDADSSHCRISRTADGGSLATGHESTEGGGTLYLVDYVHPNGANFLMHLSNLADPKGAGRSYGDTPPLTEDQVVAILESDTWDQS